MYDLFVVAVTCLTAGSLQDSLPPSAPSARVIFRHGMPHQHLPQCVPWRAHAVVCRHLGVQSALVTSSVSVSENIPQRGQSVPLHVPIIVTDIFFPDNKLPDGSVCSLWYDGPPSKRLAGHLISSPTLFSAAVVRSVLQAAAASKCVITNATQDSCQPAADSIDQVPAAQAQRAALALAPKAGTSSANGSHDAPGGSWRLTAPFVFAYFPGPRTKTPAENAYLASLPVHGNSMTLAPEVVLLGEMGIPCAAVALPHKHSVPAAHDSAHTLNMQMDQLDAPGGPTAADMGPYVYVHGRARSHTPSTPSEGGTGTGQDTDHHNRSEASMRATLEGGQAALSRLVLAWLVQEAGWAPPGADPLRWYLAEMGADAEEAHEAAEGRS